MLRELKLLLVFLTLMLAGTAYADPPGRVARLNHVEGAVSFAPGDAPEHWTQAELNRPVTAGDRLWVDAGGRAELHVGSSALRLGSGTGVDVLNFDDDTLQVRVAQGVMNLRVRDLEQGETVEIATPTAAILVTQPGSYRITVDPRRDVSRVVVNFGEAEIVTPEQRATLPSGQAALVPADAAITYEVAGASADEFDRWSAERDRREDRVASSRYVSREMTGYEDLDQYGTWQTLPEYGAVWVPTNVGRDWAPYRDGHWVWISPWGWTWVDDAPWGFAPSHYGRWVWLNGYWAWAPGAVVRRPVYAPALVAFVGGSGFSVGVSSGPAVGWFPLGWREPYIPWYRASQRHVHHLNPHVTNVTNFYSPTYVRNVNFAYRTNPRAVTVVPRDAFVSARPVRQASLSFAPAQLTRAEILHGRQPAEPLRSSFTYGRTSPRPPAQTLAREVFAVSAPTSTATKTTQAGATTAPRWSDERRVRVLRGDRAAAQATVPVQSDARIAPRVEDRPELRTERAPRQIDPRRVPTTEEVYAPRERAPRQIDPRRVPTTEEVYAPRERAPGQIDPRRVPTTEEVYTQRGAPRLDQRMAPRTEDRPGLRAQQAPVAPAPQAPAVTRPAAPPAADARPTQRDARQAEARPAAQERPANGRGAAVREQRQDAHEQRQEARGQRERSRD